MNADESEPGTYKDRLIMENDPHQLIEALRRLVPTRSAAKICYIYIRGEFHEGSGTLEKALEEAYAAGYVGKNILGTGVDVDIVRPPRRGLLRVRRGDGAHREPGGQARPAAA